MNGLDWFPQEYADTFYILKGVGALVATLLLIIHMQRTWSTIGSWGQRLRYLTLFYFAVLITAASVEQTSQHADVNLRNLGAILGVVLLVVAMVVSLHESRHRDR